MTSADRLQYHDRCERLAYWSQTWERQRLHPAEALRLSVEAGLQTEEPDPGQVAGDSLMTFAAERGLETPQKELFSLAQHAASLADITCTLLRGVNKPWARPQDSGIGSEPWISSAFLNASQTRLQRVVLVSRWSEERQLSEMHSWRGLCETAVYEIPMDLRIVVIGQHREGKWHSAWTRGWLHPLSRSLRFKKRSGDNFNGKWNMVWRENCSIDREEWLHVMAMDMVLAEGFFDVEIPVPPPEVRAKILALAERNLKKIRETTDTPPPCPSQCDWPTPCQFRSACWDFRGPEGATGFVQISPELA